MPLACIHTHTNFCDGSDEIEAYCLAARRKGLASLGFSAHSPIFRKTGLRNDCNMNDDRLEEYIDSVHAAKKRWEGILPVYLGLEIDFIPGLMGPADRDYRDLGLDFIIASVHYVIPPRGEPFTVDDSYEIVSGGIKEGYGGDPMGMVEAYFKSEEAMIRAGAFDVLGHPDLVKKNNAGPPFCGPGFFSEEDSFYQSMTASLAALMAGKSFRAEVNTGGINRGKIKNCYPSLPFLGLFLKHGVQMVINADAHRAEDVDGHYSEARSAMLAAGYTETVLFAGRKDEGAVWESEKL